MPFRVIVLRIICGTKIEKHLALYFTKSDFSGFRCGYSPCRQNGHGIMFDHATGIVVGETPVIEMMCLSCKVLPLGGTGKESGDRHPKVREGVMIGAGAKFSVISKWANMPKLGPTLLYFQPVPEYATAAGVPASHCRQRQRGKTGIRNESIFYR